MPLGDSLTGLLARLLAAAVLPAARGLWLLRGRGRASKQHARAAALYAELLSAAPGGACLWRGRARRFEMTGSLRALFRLEAEPGWTELLARLTDPDRQRLAEAARALEAEAVS